MVVFVRYSSRLVGAVDPGMRTGVGELSRVPLGILLDVLVKLLWGRKALLGMFFFDDCRVVGVSSGFGVLGVVGSIFALGNDGEEAEWTLLTSNGLCLEFLNMFERVRISGQSFDMMVLLRTTKNCGYLSPCLALPSLPLVRPTILVPSNPIICHNPIPSRTYPGLLDPAPTDPSAS